MNYQNNFVRKNYYSYELKHKICKEHMQEGIRLRDLVRKYNLSSHSLIHEWLRNLGYLPCNNRRITKCNYIDIENVNMPDKPGKKKPVAAADEQEVAHLKKELEDARLLAEGYRRIIEIAEAELKVPIRKKHNTR
jgi:hypothetical protein